MILSLEKIRANRDQANGWRQRFEGFKSARVCKEVDRERIPVPIEVIGISVVSNELFRHFSNFIEKGVFGVGKSDATHKQTWVKTIDFNSSDQMP